MVVVVCRVRYPTALSLLLDYWRHFGKALHLESFGRLEESGQLVLGYVHFTSVHEFEDRLQMSERHVFKDNDGMFRWVFLFYNNSLASTGDLLKCTCYFEKGFEVGTAR